MGLKLYEFSKPAKLPLEPDHPLTAGMELLTEAMPWLSHSAVGDPQAAFDSFLDGRLFVASHGRGAVGVGSMEESLGEAWLDALAVARSYRGLHLGSKLVSMMAREAYTLSYSELNLQALPSAVDFYRRLGFSVVTETAKYTQMVLALDPSDRVTPLSRAAAGCAFEFKD